MKLTSVSYRIYDGHVPYVVTWHCVDTGYRVVAKEMLSRETLILGFYDSRPSVKKSMQFLRELTREESPK